MLTEGWYLAVTEAGGVEDPSGLSALADWVPAKVPGTAAEALAAAGRYDPENPWPLHDKDIWYVTDFAADMPGPRILRFDGLATIAEIYLNGEKILDSRNMFLGHEVPVELTVENRLSSASARCNPLSMRRAPAPAGGRSLQPHRASGSSAPRFWATCPAGARMCMRSVPIARSP